MPQPARMEKLSHFVSRFVKSGEAEKSFPSKKQRLAVAYSEFKQSKKR